MASKKAKLIEEDGCLVKMIHLGRVKKARKQESSFRELDHLSLIFKAIADPTRLKIAMVLLQGEMCVCDLAAFLGISDSAVSHQIRRLKDLSLVKNRREGQVLYYSLDDQHVSDLLKVGLDHVRE